jgi:hypothetical protein
MGLGLFCRGAITALWREGDPHMMPSSYTIRELIEGVQGPILHETSDRNESNRVYAEMWRKNRNLRQFSNILYQIASL